MVNSVTPQQQIPAANTFQPGGNDTPVKRTDDTKVDDSSRQQNAAQLRAEKTDTRNTDTSYKAAANDSAQDNGRASANKSRGQTLDITV